jgi:hypothetical protein
MATTTNYSWTTPDDTALVKDGAAAIRTLGSSADTTVKALNPGTTAGDIDYYTTSTAKARVAIGTTGQVLSVVGGVPAWATPAAAGGLTLLSTTTLSGTSTTISGISGSYKNLRILIYGLNLATAGEIRVAPNGTNNIATQTWARFSTVSATRNTYLWIQQSGYIAASDTSNSYGLDIYNYASTAARKPFQVFGTMFNNSSQMESYWGAGGITTTSAITSLVFDNSQGGTVTGTVLIYGEN